MRVVEILGELGHYDARQLHSSATLYVRAHGTLRGPVDASGKPAELPDSAVICGSCRDTVCRLADWLAHVE